MARVRVRTTKAAASDWVKLSGRWERERDERASMTDPRSPAPALRPRKAEIAFRTEAGTGVGGSVASGSESLPDMVARVVSNDRDSSNVKSGSG